MNHKKFSSTECLEALIKTINEDQGLVRNHIPMMTADQVHNYYGKLLPAINDHQCWERISTKRPPMDKDSGSFGGTDKEIRTYENLFWEEEGFTLIGVVTVESGEITEISVQVK